MIYMEALSGCMHAVEAINQFILFEKQETGEGVERRQVSIFHI